MKNYKKKTTNNSKSESKLSKNKTFLQIPNFYEEYLMKRSGMNEQKAISFANHQIQWTKENPKAITLEEFLIAENHNRALYFEWKKEYPVIQWGHQEQKKLFSARRELLAKEKDAKFLSNTMIIYSLDGPDSHKELEEMRQKAKQTAQGNSTGTIQVVMQPIENSPLVPPKDKE